ncbi:MAG: hypothetical protein H0U76_29615 [Ktedonobacteraceae bacterium]|nr:hypothetical protein [Ktedonobacteraceae bacterium]
MISTLYNNIQVATFVVGVVAALGISLLYKARLHREQTPLPVEPGEEQEQRAYYMRRAVGVGLVVLALVALIVLIVAGINLQQPISIIGVLIGLTAGLVLIWFIQTRSEDRSAIGKDETRTHGQ